MQKILLSLDQGTSSSRSLLVNQKQEILAIAAQPFACHYPQPGWVEQDPEVIWQTQWATIGQALHQAGLSLHDLAGIGITNQRETVIAWHRETGKALGPAIVWQDRRTADYCGQLKAQGLEPLFQERTGLVLDPYFSGTKMRWMLEHYPSAQTLADQGLLCFGTVDSWLIWKLTQGQIHATDASNASRTLLFNLHTGQWDEELCRILGIPQNALPLVVASSGVLGQTHASLGGEVPIAGVAGDQQASLFGQACFAPGAAKNTYGTGCFLLANSGTCPQVSQSGLLTTVAWRIGQETTYALEGSVFIGGALIQWLRDGMGLFAHASETEAMAQAVPDAGGVFLVPAFVGLGAPHWDPYARGLIIGLTRDTNKNHLVRAGLEAICYQSAEVLKAMEADLGRPLAELKVDGGAAANNFLCQFQADLLQAKVCRPAVIEATALGAAFLAGLAVGIWKDQAEVAALWHQEREFLPQLAAPAAAQKLAQWGRAVERSKGWTQVGD